MFWQRQSLLLGVNASELDDLINDMVRRRDLLENNATLSFPIAKVQDQVSLMLSASSMTTSLESCESAALIFIDIGHRSHVDLAVADSRVPALHFQAPTAVIGKKRDLNPLLNSGNLDRCLSFAHLHLVAKRPALRRPTLCLASLVGENDLLVGVTIAVLQCIFDDKGHFRDLSGLTTDDVDFGMPEERISYYLSLLIVSKRARRRRLRKHCARACNGSRPVFRG